MQAIAAIQSLFQSPPIPYEPQKHTLKGWAKYCLQIRGYSVVYADKADFAVNTRSDGKLYFRVTEQADQVDGATAWILCDRTTQTTQVFPPQPSA